MFSQNNYNESGQKIGYWVGYYDSGELKYEGNFDDGISLLLDTIRVSEIENGRVVYDDFEAGFFYSVTATYKQGTKTIIAIDGDEMALEYDDCDCEYPTDLVLNVRLAK